MSVSAALLVLLNGIVLASPIDAESVSIIKANAPRADFSIAAFQPRTPRRDLHSIACFACVLEECPEVRRYPPNETIWMKCDVYGTLYPQFGDYWSETVDGCFLMSSDYTYYPHDPNKREISTNPICDEDKSKQLPNTTSPHLVHRQEDEPPPKYIPASINSPYDVKCLQCADPLCQKDSTLAKNASIELECWTVSTMGPGEVISFPRYEEKWLMTKEGCYLPWNEVTIHNCTNYKDCMPYCEPPPHYWAAIKDSSLERACPHNCSGPHGYASKQYTADFDCWAIGDTVQGNNTWYRETEFYYAGRWYTYWWPKAALGAFGGTGEPITECPTNETGPVPPQQSAPRGRAQILSWTRAIGHASPRAVQNVYAVVNQIDVRCRLCTKRICPYYTLYQPGDQMNFECFVYGSSVEGSDVWFKSAENTRCYVPRRYVTLNGGSSISYCHGDKRSAPLLGHLSNNATPPTSLVERVPKPRVSDPSQSPDPPPIDRCQDDPNWWETYCFNQALRCCAQKTPVDWYWWCTDERAQKDWKGACKDLRSNTNCTVAMRLGDQMEGCEGGDVWRDPS